MTSNPNHRHTQIFFDRLREPWQHLQAGKVTEQADVTSSRTAAEQDTAKRLARERASSPERVNIDLESGLVRLKLVEAANSGVRAHAYIMTKEGSPWRSYEKIYQLRLGVSDRVTVAERKSHPFGVVTVRSFSGPRAEDVLRMLQRIHHPNFVSALDAFRFEQSLYVVFEHMPISLQHIAGNPYMNELRLASILGQVLQGLAHLATEGLEHGSLTCSSILIGPDGDVKIANQECCHDRLIGSTESRDIRALRVITMELMQGYAKDDGAIGVDDLHRWPLGSAAVGFLSETTSASSVTELMEHPLMRLPWRKEKLRGLVSLASLCARRDYKYTPSGGL